MSASSTPAPRPKVTVLVTTYNHERYLGDALESALRQQGDVDYEVLVADDASSDGTTRVALSYRDRHPDTVRVLRPVRNLGANEMFLSALEEVRGDYVALLDGDDAWAGSDKLARQAAFLDANPEVSGCFHDSTLVYDDGSHPPRDALAALRQPVLDLADIIVRPLIPTSTLMYRHLEGAELRRWFEAVAGQAWDRVIHIDWLMLMLLAQQGPLVRLDGMSATYRVHGGGVWSSIGRLAQLADERLVYRRIARLLPAAVRPAVTMGLVRCAVEVTVEEAGIPHDRPVAVAGPVLPTPWYLNGRDVLHLSAVDGEAAHQLDALRADAVADRQAVEQHFGSLPSMPADEDIAGYLIITEPREARPGRPGLWTYADGLTCLSDDGRIALYELPVALAPQRRVIDVVQARAPREGIAGANLESPIPGRVATRTMRLFGWSVPTSGPARRVVMRTAGAGRFLASAPLDVPRPDVAAVHGEARWATTSGFSVEVVLSDRADDLDLDLVIELADGSQVVLATVRLAVETGALEGGPQLDVGRDEGG